MRGLLGLLAGLVLAVGLAVPAGAVVPSVWRVAIVVYPSVDAVCEGRQIVSALSQAEKDEVINRSRRFRNKVEKWSEYMADIRLDFLWSGKLTKVSPLGDGFCWPTPWDLEAMNEWPVGYDSVYVQYAGKLNNWGGLSYDGYLHRGSTYATNEAWQTNVWWWDQPIAAEMMVHEWLHGAGGYYRSSFGQIPDLHAKADYGYTSDTEWYKDFLSGDIVSGSQRLGLTLRVWDSGP